MNSHKVPVTRSITATATAYSAIRRAGNDIRMYAHDAVTPELRGELWAAREAMRAAYVDAEWIAALDAAIDALVKAAAAAHGTRAWDAIYDALEAAQDARKSIR